MSHRILHCNDNRIFVTAFILFLICLKAEHILIAVVANIWISFHIAVKHTMPASKTKTICWNPENSCIHRVHLHSYLHIFIKSYTLTLPRLKPWDSFYGIPWLCSIHRTIFHRRSAAGHIQPKLHMPVSLRYLFSGRNTVHGSVA